MKQMEFSAFQSLKRHFLTKRTNEMPKRIELYLDIDGVLLTKKATRPADSALPFLNFVTQQFDCFWLTTHCNGDNKTALRYLGQFFDEAAIDKMKAIKPTNWTTLKTEAIDFDKDFFWLDDNPLQTEIDILESIGKRSSLFIVNLENKNELMNLQTSLHRLSALILRPYYRGDAQATAK